MTIYAVVKIEKEPARCGFRIYSNQTSNFKRIKEYAKEIALKYPSDEVRIMSREGAQELKKKYYKMWKKIEKIELEIKYQKMLMKNL